MGRLIRGRCVVRWGGWDARASRSGNEVLLLQVAALPRAAGHIFIAVDVLICAAIWLAFGPGVFSPAIRQFEHMYPFFVLGICAWMLALPLRFRWIYFAR